MMKISACIISFNEEQRIEECLRSLVGVVDEIVVVDSLSTDATVEIAHRYTDRVESQKFLGYIGQKSYAFELASHDWILNLDCDERLTPELRESILAEKERLDEMAAYELTRRTYYVTRFMRYCWYPEYRVRLFDRRRCKSGGTEPHDKIVILEGKRGRLSGDLLHYSFPSISAHLRTLDKFTEIAAVELIEKGRRVSVLSPLIHGSWAFFRIYVLKRGFLDGFPGLVASTLTFVHVFVKYSKVITMSRANNSTEQEKHQAARESIR